MLIVILETDCPEMSKMSKIREVMTNFRTFFSLVRSFTSVVARGAKLVDVRKTND